MMITNKFAAKIPLDIAIIGAGIGGLSAALAFAQAGMTVTVYEAALEIEEVGAGLQLGPNMLRIMRRWGFCEFTQFDAVSLKALSLRRYADDSELSYVSLNDAENIYGASMMTAHRADVQKALRKEVEAAGVHIKLGCRIEDVDFQNCRIKIENCSTWIVKDVVIAADGIRSLIRGKILALHGEDDKIKETGDAAWRVLISAEQIHTSRDADLIGMLESHTGFRWIGPNGHVVTYPIRNKQFLNVVFLHPKNSTSYGSWTNKSDKKDMLKFYENWDPRIKKLLDFVPDGEILEWNLRDSDLLPTWIEGNVALMGDAAHPMLPYIAQGAGQAIEDAAVLAICLGMIDSKDQINIALRVYELLRKERAEIIQISAIRMQEILHLHDGIQQQTRDDLIRNGGKGSTNPDLWSDRSFEEWCWGMDVQQQTIDSWDEFVKLISDGKKILSSFNTSKHPWLTIMNK